MDLRIPERLECNRKFRANRKLGPFYDLPNSTICANGIVDDDTCTGDGE